MQILAQNPIFALDGDAPSRAAPKVDAYTDAEIAALLEQAGKAPWDRWGSAIMLALATGARRGELAALSWQDVHLQKELNGTERGTLMTSKGFVFATPLGTPLRPNEFTNAFRKIARRAGVKKRLHDARHWTASHLIAAGVDVRTVATLLGHSTPQTTLNVYAHQLSGLTGPAMEKLDDRLRAAIQSKK
jgi:integrase